MSIEVKKKTSQPSFNDFFTPEDIGSYLPKDKTEVFRPRTIVEAKKHKELQELHSIYDQFKTFEELEKYVASQYGRRHIGYPCDDAQDLPLIDRPRHIKDCSECKRLLQEFEQKIHYNPSKVVEEKDR